MSVAQTKRKVKQYETDKSREQTEKKHESTVEDGKSRAPIALEDINAPMRVIVQSTGEARIGPYSAYGNTLFFDLTLTYKLYARDHFRIPFDQYTPEDHMHLVKVPQAHAKIHLRTFSNHFGRLAFDYIEDVWDLVDQCVFLCAISARSSRPEPTAWSDFHDMGNVFELRLRFVPLIVNKTGEFLGAIDAHTTETKTHEKKMEFLQKQLSEAIDGCAQKTQFAHGRMIMKADFDVSCGSIAIQCATHRSRGESLLVFDEETKTVKGVIKDHRFDRRQPIQLVDKVINGRCFLKHEVALNFVRPTPDCGCESHYKCTCSAQ